MPPSMVSAWPAMAPAAGEHSQSASAATSAGSTMRLSGYAGGGLRGVDAEFGVAGLLPSPCASSPGRCVDG